MGWGGVYVEGVVVGLGRATYGVGMVWGVRREVGGGYRESCKGGSSVRCLYCRVGVAWCWESGVQYVYDL